MWARLSIVAGLLVGVAAAALLLGGLLALAPETPLPSVATPSAAVASAGPSRPPSASPSEVAAASSSLPDTPFHVGQPAPLAVPQTIMPGVDVTP